MPEPSNEMVFEGRRFSVRVDEVDLPGGLRSQREIVVCPNAVGILAYTDEGKVLMVEQYRHAVGKDVLEIPAGVVEPGETPLACAVRELAEETGYAAQHMDEMATIYLSPGVLSERMTLFRAWELLPSEVPSDPGERIHVTVYDPEDLVEMAKSGMIEDAKTIAALFYSNV